MFVIGAVSIPIEIIGHTLVVFVANYQAMKIAACVIQ